MNNKHPAEFTDANFESEVLKSDVPVLVDFWAAWCGPCRAVGPVIEQLANEYGATAKIGKLNVDENQAIAAQFGVTGIPTIIILKDGQEAERLVGLQAEDQLLAKLNSLL